MAVMPVAGVSGWNDGRRESCACSRPLRPPSSSAAAAAAPAADAGEAEAVVPLKLLRRDGVGRS
jgi:hypothetical protein